MTARPEVLDVGEAWEVCIGALGPQSRIDNNVWTTPILQRAIKTLLLAVEDGALGRLSAIEIVWRTAT